MNLLWLQINFACFQAEEFTLNLGWPLCRVSLPSGNFSSTHASVTAVSADRSVGMGWNFNQFLWIQWSKHP